MSTAAGPSGDLTIVQLTDTHITAGGKLVHDAVDTLDSLRRTLDRIVGSGRRVDALVLSGDLTDNGAPEAYRRLRAVVEPAAAASVPGLSTPWVITTSGPRSASNCADAAPRMLGV